MACADGACAHNGSPTPRVRAGGARASLWFAGRAGDVPEPQPFERTRGCRAANNVSPSHGAYGARSAVRGAAPFARFTIPRTSARSASASKTMPCLIVHFTPPACTSFPSRSVSTPVP